MRRANQSKNGLLALEAGTVTAARMLHDAGYATGGFGKWGLGNEGTTGAAEKQGFDIFYGYYDQVHAHSYFPDDLTRNGVREKLPGNANGKGTQYSHDLIEAETLKFIEANAKGAKPFFCYAAWTLPHGKFEIPSHAQFADRPWPEPVKIHAAMIARLDAGRGQNHGEASRARNRPEHAGDFHERQRRRGTGIGNVQRERRPARREARLARRRDSRAVSSRAGRERSRRRRRATCITSHVDFMATAAELAGTKAPRNDGISIVPTLLGRPQPTKHEFLFWEIYEGPAPFQQAVRFGKWKGYRTGTKAPLELYDLDADPAEAKNVAAQHADVVKSIEAIMAREHVPSPNYDAPQEASARKGRRKEESGGVEVGVRAEVRSRRGFVGRNISNANWHQGPFWISDDENSLLSTR